MANVTIKVAFDQIDTSPVQTAMERVSKWQEQTSTKAIESERKVSAERKRAADSAVSSAMAGGKEWQKQFDAKIRSVEREIADINRVAAAEQARLVKLHALQKRAHYAYLQMGDAAFRVGTGVATLGIIGEQSAEKLLKQLASIHALYDIVSGTSRIAMSMKESSFVAGLVKNVSAGAGAAGAGSVAAGVGGAAGGVAGVAASPVVLAALAVSAAVLGREMVSLGGEMLQLEKSTQRLNSAISARDAAERRRAEVGALQEKRAAHISLFEGMQATLSQLNPEANKIGDIEARIAREAARTAAARADIERQSRPTTVLRERDRTWSEYGTDWASMFSRGWTGVNETGDRSRRRETVTTASTVNRSELQASLSREVEAAQSLAAARRAEVDALQQTKTTQEAIVKSMGDQVRTAQQLVETEKARYETALARFGAMSKTEQAELKRIADKHRSGGVLSVEEAITLQKSGFGGSIAEKRLALEGAASGGMETLMALGEGAGVSAAQANLERAKAAEAAAANDLADTNAALNSAFEVLGKSIEALKDRMNAVLAEGENTVGGQALRVREGVLLSGKAVGEILDQVLQSQETLIANLETRRSRASAISQALQG